MKKLADIKIRSKLFLLVGTASVFLFFLLFFVLYNTNKIKQAKDEILSGSLALSYFQDADMKHDAIRGDVYRSLHVDKKNPDMVAEAKAEVQEHSEQFLTDIETAKSLPVAKEVKEAFSIIIPLIGNYAEVSKKSVSYFLNTDSLDQKIVTTYLGELDEAFKALESAQDEAFSQVRAYSAKVKEESDKVIMRSNYTLIVLVLILIAVSLIFGFILSNSLQKPVVQTQKALEKIADGEIPELSKIGGKDELGMMLGSLNSLIQNLGNVKQFVNEVGKGNFTTQIELFGNKGDIANSLYEMRDNLKIADERDKNQNWVNVGLAEFGILIRKDNLGIDKLSQQIVQYVIKYINANQGALFFINEDTETQESYWEMMACAAYGKARHVQKRVEIEEGLLGRIYLEQEYLYFTDVPKDYVNITSGIGEATPGCLIIVPLKNNDVVVGALEIAAFSPFKPQEQDFIFKVADTIASTVMNIKTNYKTTKLLETTQMQTESMRAQEEELRQNLEELSSTQEEMQIKENIYIQKIEKLEAELEKIKK